MPVTIGQTGGLGPVRERLYTLHRTLVTGEQRAAERARGQLPPGDFLQALLHDPEHAWLRPLSALLARLDAHLADRGPGHPPEESAADLVTEVRALVHPPRAGTRFGDGYLARLQEDPAIVVAHARLRGELERLAPPEAAA